MDQYELGVALAAARIAELRRHADRWRLAGRIPGRTARRRGNRTPGSPWVLGRHDQAADCAVAASGPGRGTTEAAMLVQHHRQPGVFDAGRCQACAHQAGLVDHYQLVQQEEATCGRPTDGPWRPAGAPALRCGRPAPPCCWPPSPC